MARLSKTGILLLFPLAAALAQWNVLPMPASIHAGSGPPLVIGQNFRIALEGASDARLERAAQRLTARVALLTGPILLAPGAALVVRIQSAGNAVQSFDEDESYRLTVNAQGAVVTAPNPLGAMHALETFYQLITNDATGWVVPAVTIDDHPRFAWRGLHIDVARHFIPLDVIRRNLDGMAAVKLNVFHWHLSDDQGFRIESKRFPKLHEMGSDGLCYTQDEARGLIEFARDRGIRVVPEFDIPGHATSWLVGYPELAASPGPFQIIRTWGVHDPTMDPAKPEVYTFLDAFIGEMASLFPDAYFHIGGDEVKNKPQQDLQASFNQQVEKIVTKYGKRMEGWDEILSPALPKNIVIQSWRGAKSLADGARQGYQGILSSGYYLDHMEPSSKLYLVDPLGDQSATLTTEEKARILGGEVCMWAEYVSAENIESRIWPRTAAIAERFWSRAEIRNVAGMYRRLDIVDGELDQLGLRHNSTYRIMLERLVGSNDIDALEVLADVTEPGALGLRHHVNPDATQNTPLNRLVDAVRPESAVARHFNNLVDGYLANRNDAALRAEIRQWLSLWAGNDAKLEPLIAKRQILKDAAPVSQTLSKIAGATLTPSKKNRAEFEAAQKPIGDMHLAVAEAIARLINSPAPHAGPSH
ncbi:MAG: family 20 glycosylhydrolase [Bryobacteraceae bacterium]|jgi:hexosaminidase